MALKPEEFLLMFSKTMIRDLGKVDGRRYLLRNVPLWREHYGEAVTKRVCAGIQKILKEEVK